MVGFLQWLGKWLGSHFWQSKTSSSSTSSSYPVVADDRCIRRYDLIPWLMLKPSMITSLLSLMWAVPIRLGLLSSTRQNCTFVEGRGGQSPCLPTRRRRWGAEGVSSTWDGWITTGHDDRRLALWKEEKKRPVGSVVAEIGSVSGEVVWQGAWCVAIGFEWRVRA